MSANNKDGSSSDKSLEIERPTTSKRKHVGNWTFQLYDSIWKLVESGFTVYALADKGAIAVVLCGPKETPFENGKWSVQVDFPENYPIEPPQLVFLNQIWHPNVSHDGTICLDLLDGKWEKTYDLKMVFEYILPQMFTKAHFEETLSGGNVDEKFECLYETYAHDVKSRFLNQKTAYRVVLGNSTLITKPCHVCEIMEKISEKVIQKRMNS